jgi:hypothetical protein
MKSPVTIDGIHTDTPLAGPKVAERIFSNKIFLRELRSKLKARQPENETFHRIVDALDDRTLVEQYLRHKPVTLDSEKAKTNEKMVKLRELFRRL